VPRVDRKLLSHGELDDGLLLAAAKKGDGALEDQTPEGEQRPHHRRKEPESDESSGLSYENERERRGRET
jgi:hypothetical protein